MKSRIKKKNTQPMKNAIYSLVSLHLNWTRVNFSSTYECGNMFVYCTHTQNWIAYQMRYDFCQKQHFFFVILLCSHLNWLFICSKLKIAYNCLSINRLFWLFQLRLASTEQFSLFFFQIHDWNSNRMEFFEFGTKIRNKNTKCIVLFDFIVLVTCILMWFISYFISVSHSLSHFNV